MRTEYLIARIALLAVLTAGGSFFAPLTIVVSVTGLMLLFYLHKQRGAGFIWTQ
jgi:hypothetical protein